MAPNLITSPVSQVSSRAENNNKQKTKPEHFPPQVSSGSAKVAFKTLTQNRRSGEMSFSKLPASMRDGEYVFTLQHDYGVR